MKKSISFLQSLVVVHIRKFVAVQLAIKGKSLGRPAFH